MTSEGISHGIYVFIILALGRATQSQDPCTTYQSINEPLRSTGHVTTNAAYDHLICDRLLTPGWYRFTSGAGGEMPTSCPGLFHCGTHVPIWMNGTHPTVADGIVSRQTCGHQPTTGCCGLKGTIRVKNCGSYYVYNLKPTLGCSIAHCAGTSTPCPPDKWSPTGFEPGCKEMFPKMLQSPTLSNPIVKGDTFEFNCHINFDTSQTNVGFDVTWLFDGKPDQNVPVGNISGSSRDLSIDQKYLVGHLGQELSCRADAYFLQTPGRKGPPVPSNGYWMGIKLSEARLEVGEHDKPKEVKLISTIPIVCDKSFQNTCHLDIYLEPNNHDFKTTTSCTVTLKPTDWNPTTNQAVTKFEVLAERDFKRDQDKNLMLHFNRIFSADAPPVFNNYQIPYLQVITKDKPTGLCSCVGDPHCITLDHSPSTSPDLNLGRLWSSQRRYMYDSYKLGEFVMYKSTSRPFEVQIRNWQCGRAVCICAVAAREGNDIIMIDICHGTYGHTFPKVTIPNKSSFSQGTVLQKDRAGNKYVISFPSGATVTVINDGKELNVYVNAPEDDYQHTQGLCGTFDGRRDNDQTGKDGLVHHWSRRPNTFVESWRVPVGSSIFDNPPPPDPKFNNDIYYCNCNQAKKQVDCRIDGKASRPALHTRCPGCHVVVPQKPNLTGRKRQIAGLDGTDNDTVIKYFFDYGLLWNSSVTSDFPTPSGLTEVGATKLCKDALQQSRTVSQCVSHVGLNFFNEFGSCVEDLKLTDDVSFVHSAVQTAIMSCQEYVLKNLSFYNNATGDPPAFITSDLCPSDCSGHGNCIQGTCHCDSGFVGEACEIDSTKAPSLYNIISSTNHMQRNSENCDVQQRPCRKLYIVGNNILERNISACHLKELQFVNGSFTGTGRSFQTRLDYETMYNVLCHMPTRNQIGGKQVIGYNISLTNDGRLYSNELQTFIVDSECLSCSDIGGLCKIKPNACLIDGVCRKANEFKQGNTTLSCQPDRSDNEWAVIAKTQFPNMTHTVLSTSGMTTTTMSSQLTSLSNSKPNSVSTTLPSVGITVDNIGQTNLTGSITQWYFAHLPPGPPGGQAVPRFDIWTLTTSGCTCPFNTSSSDCACCDVDGCLCPGSNQYQCVQCGHTENCGRYLPSPEKGVDGYTLHLAECACSFNPNRFNCACCQNNGCQCDKSYQNQCVRCGHKEQCGIKPWLFGPAFNSTN